MISKKEKIKIIYYKLSNAKQKLKFFMQKFNNKETSNLLKKNHELKNIHQGKRCFILGNGPSLKKVDFDLLSEEYVFTVNQIARNENFSKLKTNYHFWADPAFFNINENKPEDLELLNYMKKIKGDNNPISFFPIEQHNFIKKHKLDETINVKYFSSKIKFYKGYKDDIDFTKLIPGFGTVVQWAIIMAIYMGFKEIYLLGCDNTGIINNIKSFMKQNDDKDYAYKMTNNEKKRMENMVRQKDLKSYVKAYLSIIEGYEFLYEYTKRRDISLINCTIPSAIDSLPQKPLNKVLKYKDKI